VALTYASAIVWNAEIADDALWAKLRQHFSNPELVELGFFIALTLGQQRWIKTLGIGHREVLADTSTGLAPTAAAGGDPTHQQHEPDPLQQRLRPALRVREEPDQRSPWRS